MEYVEQKYYYHNDQEVSTDNLHPFEQLTGKNVYEVIRVREGIPLFLEDHLRRFRAFAFVFTGNNDNCVICFYFHLNGHLLIFFRF